MRIIELKKCATYRVNHRGRLYHFEKNKPVQIPDRLADKLLSTGDFMDIIIDNLDFQVEAVTTNPQPLVVEEDEEEVIVPLDKMEQTIDHKMEISTDLKKVKKRGRKRKHEDISE